MRQNHSSTQFCVIRHGETAWNAERRYQGQIDIDLNAKGEAQARALQPVLAMQEFTAVYASNLKRAWRTAQIALDGAPDAVLPAPTLRERHYGVFQGLTVNEARSAHPLAHRHYLARSLDYDFETGESLRAFSGRVLDAFAGLAARHPGGKLLVLTHGGVLDVLHRAASGQDLATARSFLIPNAALNWLRCGSAGWQIERWADCSHLTSVAAALDEVAR